MKFFVNVQYKTATGRHVSRGWVEHRPNIKTERGKRGYMTKRRRALLAKDPPGLTLHHFEIEVVDWQKY